METIFSGNLVVIFSSNLVVIFSSNLTLHMGAFLGTNLTLNMGGDFLCESLTSNRWHF